MARPRGLRLNTSALNSLLAIRGLSRADAATAAAISPQMLSDMAGPKRAGASNKTAAALAAALGCEPGLLFPELVGFTTEEVAA
jgi:DNA-binding Xre family transcriptional regulator